MSSNYSLHRIDQSSFVDLQKLYKSVYGHHPSLEEMAKVFNTSDFGLFTIGFIAKHIESGEIAAYYGVFPVIGGNNEQEVLIAQSGATMTSPSHQKKGLFTLLASKTFETAKQEGVQLIFGFPNENSLPGFINKLGWSFAGNMMMLKMKSGTFPLAEIASKSRLLQSIYFRWVKRKLKKLKITAIDSAFNNDDHEKIWVKRSEVYLNYKLKNSGVHLLEINGFTIIISVTTHLYIGEVSRFPATKIDDFLRSIDEIAIEVKAGKIVFVLSENHWLYDILSNKLEFKSSLPIGGLNLTGESLDISKMCFSVLDYDTFK